MHVLFERAAEEELLTAAEYYQAQRYGLGFEFLDEVAQAVTRIIEFPFAWTSISPKSRRCLLRRFPYALVYQLRDSSVVIIAVMHLSRRPGYWHGRER